MQSAERMKHPRALFLWAAAFPLLLFAGAQTVYAAPVVGCNRNPSRVPKSVKLCEDVACFCDAAQFPANTCDFVSGELVINNDVRVGCKSFNFSSEGLGKVTINATVETRRKNGCVVEFVLDELTVGPAGLWRACVFGGVKNTRQIVTGPGGEARRILVEDGGAIVNIAHPSRPNAKHAPRIELYGSEVEIRGLLAAAAKKAQGTNARISIRSASDNGYVLIAGGTARVATGAQDPGSAFIDIFACFIEVDAGTVDASVKRNRQGRNGVLMVARETIWIHRGALIDAEVREAQRGQNKAGGIVMLVAGNGVSPTAGPHQGFLPIPAALVVEDSEIDADVVGANGPDKDKQGAVRMLAARGKVLVDDSEVHADSMAAGNSGGTVMIMGDGKVANDGASNITTLGGGSGGSVLLKSFNDDVDGSGTVNVAPGGTCDVESCNFPPTSNFGCGTAAECTSCDVAFNVTGVPDEIVELFRWARIRALCTDEPCACSLEPCGRTGCACVLSFEPLAVPAGSLPVQVTLKGFDMASVSEVRLNHIGTQDCSPTAGTLLVCGPPSAVAACDAPDPGDIACTIPGGTAPGDYQFVLITPAGSFCTTQDVPFTVNP